MVVVHTIRTEGSTGIGRLSARRGVVAPSVVDLRTDPISVYRRVVAEWTKVIAVRCSINRHSRDPS